MSLLLTISSGSMNHLVEKLNNLVEDTESSEITASIASSYLPGFSQATHMQDEETWILLQRELENSGLSPSVLMEQREFINKWIINVSKAGRLRRENESHEASVADDEAMVTSSTSVEQKVVTSEVIIPSARRRGGSNIPLIRRIRYGIFRPKHYLLEAVEKRDLAMARELLALKNSIDVRDKSGISLTAIAALNGDIEMMKLLLDEGQSTPKFGQMALYEHDAMAVSLKKRNWGAVEALLPRVSSFLFSNLEIVDAIENVSPHTLRKMKELRSPGSIDDDLILAVENGNTKLLEFVLTEGANVNAKTKPKRLSGLHFGAANCNIEVMKLLLDNGADIEARDASGETPLHKIPCARDGIGISCFDGSGKRIPHRIFSPEKGWDPFSHLTLKKISNTRGNRSHHFAEIYNDKFVISCDPAIALQLLLDNGAKVKEKNYAGQTAIHLSAMYNEDSVMALLIENGLDIEAVDNKGNTAIHVAISPVYIQELDTDKYDKLNQGWRHKEERCGHHWNKEVALRLLRSKANVNARNYEGKTPLHLACMDMQGSAAKFLLENGADVDAVDHQNYTALHYAVGKQSLQVVITLLQFGASASLKCDPTFLGSGDTALEMARENKSNAIVEVLQVYQEDK